MTDAKLNDQKDLKITMSERWTALSLQSERHH